MTFAASFAVAILSGLVPVINAEIYLVGVVLAVGGIPEALLLALIVALGQMVAKVFMYQAALRATNLGKRSPRLEPKIQKARAYVEKWRSKPLSITFVSATIGLPPFYLVALVAGMLEVPFRAFFVVGLVGRTLRFATIAVIAAIV